jgi:hypothetical protein
MRLAKLGTKRNQHSDETKRKMSVAAKGRTPNDETREKMRVAKLGKPGPWIGIKRGPQSAKWRANISAANYGRPAYYPKQRFYYRDIPFRSSWEVLLAKAFDERQIKWEYETQKFDLGSETYTIDFYLPEQECFWEVKGWYGPQAKKTVNLFREKFPEVPLVVATKHVLKAMGITSPLIR